MSQNGDSSRTTNEQSASEITVSRLTMRRINDEDFSNSPSRPDSGQAENTENEVSSIDKCSTQKTYVNLHTSHSNKNSTKLVSEIEAKKIEVITKFGTPKDNEPILEKLKPHFNWQSTLNYNIISKIGKSIDIVGAAKYICGEANIDDPSLDADIAVIKKLAGKNSPLYENFTSIHVDENGNFDVELNKGKNNADDICSVDTTLLSLNDLEDLEIPKKYTFSMLDLISCTPCATRMFKITTTFDSGKKPWVVYRSDNDFKILYRQLLKKFPFSALPQPNSIDRNLWLKFILYNRLIKSSHIMKSFLYLEKREYFLEDLKNVDKQDKIINEDWLHKVVVASPINEIKENVNIFENYYKTYIQIDKRVKIYKNVSKLIQAVSLINFHGRQKMNEFKKFTEVCMDFGNDLVEDPKGDEDAKKLGQALKGIKASLREMKINNETIQKSSELAFLKMQLVADMVTNWKKLPEKMAEIDSDILRTFITARNDHESARNFEDNEIPKISDQEVANTNARIYNFTEILKAQDEMSFNMANDMTRSAFRAFLKEEIESRQNNLDLLKKMYTEFDY